MTRQQKSAFIISFIYVGLGTFWVFTSYGVDRFYFEWSPLIIITLPVTVISLAIRFGVANYEIPVIITQLLMFWGVYKLTLLILNTRKNKKS